ncbi:MAG: SDR family oxidoreductase [Actinomycetota bacterium]|jgi:3-oxoacyl-[acyl-carrier protein] reductase|nr:SDR family oxidoreductase [Actinomycetota bacterium]MDA8313754.1 SDR family oxidoreductase [Actinomycetota bacterium]
MTDVLTRPDARYADLVGKVAVVTGGSRGIGAATAAALAANGAAVAVVGRDLAAAEVAAKAIGDGGRAIAVAADCTVEADMTRLRDEVHARLGTADVLVCFAGGSGEPVATAAETAAHWRHVVDTNLTATYLTISAFLADLTATGGAIITMASSSGRQPSGASAAYAAAKAGVIGLTRHLAGELAPTRVRVNCLAPATVENDRMRAHMTIEQRQALAASFPLGRIGQPADVAAATCYLASDASSWVTGVTLDIAGGKVMP